jgi:hypothetical protein
MDKLDFLVRVRDGHRMIADAIDEYLETIAPAEVRKTDLVADLEGMVWQSATGPKGVYEKTKDNKNPSYTRLLKAVKEHQGKMTVSSYFVWLFDDQETIARRKNN